MKSAEHINRQTPNTKHKTQIILSVLILLFSLFMAGCGPSSGSEDTEEESTTDPGPAPASFIALRASDYILTANGKSETTLIAIVEDSSGYAVEGERITFAVIEGYDKDDYLDGQVNSSSEGAAEVTLTAPQISYDEFNALPDDEKKLTVQASAKNGVTSDPLDIALGMGRISLSASSPEIVADGSSESIITATVTDVNGDPVSEEHVNFAILSGTGRFKEFDTDTWRARATTSSDGSADITYIASDTAGSVNITAWVGDYDDSKLMADNTSLLADVQQPMNITYQVSAMGYTPAAMNIALVPPGEGGGDPASIQLTSDKESIPANGYSSVVIRAIIKDSSDQFVSKGTPVTFSTTRGTISETELEVPDQNGTVVVSLISSDTAGVAQVTCAAGNVRQSVDVEFTEDVPDTDTDTGPANIILWADPENIPADGEATTIIDALVTDKFGKPVAEGTSVFFRTDKGRFSNDKKGEAVVTDKSGSVSVVLKAAEEPGTATITCMAGDISRNITADFEIEDIVNNAAIISITPPNPATLTPDNTSSTVIEATISDSSGNPVPRGTLVSFVTTLGRISNSIVSTPDNSGVVKVSLIAGTESGTAQVTCESGNVSQKVTVEITTEDTPSAGSITLSAEPASIYADGEEESVIDAIVRDKSGAPVPQGTSVIFSTTLGRFSERKSEEKTTSDSTGTVTVTLRAGNTPGIAEITCSAGGVSQRIDVLLITPSPTTKPTASVSSVQLSAPSPAEIPADGISSAVITATVKDSYDSPVEGVSVTFSCSMGRLSATSLTTSENGGVSVSLISDTTPGTAEVICRAGNVSQKVTVGFTGDGDDDDDDDTDPLPTSSRLSLYASQSFVKSDNSDAAEITASALDDNYAAVEGVTITFSAEGGQLSASTVKTGADGTAKVTFSSGASKENRTVFVTASTGSLSKSVPIKITGTFIELEADKTNLGQAVLTITVRDAHEDPVYNAEVEIRSVDSADAITENNILIYELLGPNHTSYNTDVNGELKLKVKGGTRTGDAMLRVESLGASATQLFTVSSVGEEFAITAPEEDPASLHTGEELEIIVSAPGRESVKFTTTFGAWKGSQSTILSNVSVNDGKASAILTSVEAGLATIQVVDETSPGVSDTLKVAISAPSEDAAKIALQASATIMSPSTGDEVNTVDLTATVKNAADQVVGGAPVAFSIENTTGGGESISPVYVLTDATGVAKAKFFSGSLGSDAKGVTVRAIVVDRSDIPASRVSIVIGGTAGSVLIGTSSKIVPVNNDTAYSLPMSVIVTDANGNPVPNAEVSLGVWPITYAKGYWDNCIDGAGICAYHSARIPNEDVNRNLILDPGEDKNGDGELTPFNTAAGNLPSTVSTDETGMAEFDLVYLKRSAIWIEDEITASVMVSGTETRSTYTLWLRYLAGEEENLSHSPFNDEDTAADPYSISLTATPSTLAANGISTCEIEATVLDINRNEVDDPTVVRFTTTAGTLYETSKTTRDGIATVTLTSPNFVSEATVTASTSSEVEGEVTVTFTAGPPAQEYSIISADPLNMSADGKSTSNIQARVSDSSGNTVSDGTLIVFDISGSGTLSSRTAATSNGTATVGYTAGLNPGSVTVTAKTTDGMPIGSVNLTLIDVIIKSVIIESGSDSIAADGVSETLITATLTDNVNNPVKDGTQVTFSTTAGRLCTGGTSCRISVNASTGNGFATVMLRSSENAGTTTVTASSGGRSDTTNVEFVAGQVGRIVLNASPESLQSGESSTIQVSVTDANGNPVKNEKITFSFTGNGSLSSRTVTTTDGTATVTYTAGDAGLATITATSANGVRSVVSLSTSVDVKPLAPPELTQGAESIVADGVSETLITATLKDTDGNPAGDGILVTFSTTAGKFCKDMQCSSSVTTSTVGGIASATLQSSENIGTAVITVSSGGTSDPASIEFVAGSVAGIELNASPASLQVGGTTKISAFVTDSAGNPVSGSKLITFSFIGGGTLSSRTANATDGTAIVDYTASATSGQVSITATSVNGIQSDPLVIGVTDMPVGELNVISASETMMADGLSETTITATVRDTARNLVKDGVLVSFSTTVGRFCTYGSCVPVVNVPTVNGVASATLRSSVDAGFVDVTASAGGVNSTTVIEFIAMPMIPASFSLSLSQITVKSDNSDNTTITATVLDENKAVVPDITVKFSSDGGQLSSAEQKTDENGQASVIFSSGTEDKTNRIINITVYVPECDAQSIPVQVVGTYVEVSTDKAILEIGGDNKADFTITVYDAGGVPIRGVEVTVKEADPDSGEPLTTYNRLSVSLSPEYDEYVTDVTGILKLEVTGKSSGEAMVIAEALGAAMTQTWTIGSDIFEIVSPTEDPASLFTGQALEIAIRAPTQQRADFSTTFGTWVENGEQVLTVPVTNETASASLTSIEAGMATVQVFDTDDPSTSDIVRVVIAAPSDEASQLAIQASSSVVAPSIGDIVNKVTLTASVKNASDQVVGGAAIAFSLQRTTGGGESVSPVIAYTDSFGIAKTTFTSGALGSDSQGVTVIGSVVGKPDVRDSIAIVIGGTAGSVFIGQSTKVESVDNDTAYKLAMSVLVSDSNGNPVSGSRVSLSAWPARYATGYWDTALTPTCPQEITGVFLNEDENRNLILDSDEDANKDNELTPPNSAAGSVVPAVITTDENGVGHFDVKYLKTSSGWIKEEITATTMVSGTEAQSTYAFWLPVIGGEQCSLPHSPYNVQPRVYVSVLAEPDTLPADGESTTVITAAVTDANGKKIEDGTTVEFATTGGRLSASSKDTENGLAEVVLTSPNYIDTATITATVEDVSGTTEVSFIAGDPALINLGAEPDTLSADGKSQSVIRAEVKDINANLVRDGISVTFTTTKGMGTFENGAETFVGVTSNGIATARITAPLTEGTVDIIATAGDLRSSVSLSFLKVSLSDMIAEPLAINADGLSVTEIRVRLKDSNGIAVPGETIRFDTTAGTLETASAVTDSNGIAKVNLTAPLEPGTGIVTAKYGSDESLQITVNFKLIPEDQVASVILSASPLSLPADGSSKSTISAVPTLVGGGEVKDDTEVSFTITRGGGKFESGENTITAYTYNGVAFATLTSGTVPETATIQAEAGDKTSEIKMEYTPGSVSLLIIPSTVLGTDHEIAEVTATLKDVTGDPATEGEIVEFTLDDVTLGTYVDEEGAARTPMTVVTNAQGEAQVRFRGAAKGGEASIIATWHTNEVDVTGLETITIQPPPDFMKVAEGYPDPVSINIKGTGGQATSQIVFEVKDAQGDPVADGYRIDFTILSGPDGGEMISPPFGLTTTVTDEEGNALSGRVATVLRSGFKSGPVSIEATYFYDSGVSTATSQIAIEAGPPVGEQFGISAQYVNISGLWKFGLEDIITVSALDHWGNSIPDNTAISFKTYGTGGLFEPGSSVTSDGFATSSLFSVPDPVPAQGFVSITAEAINGGRTTHATCLEVFSETVYNQILYAGTNGGGVYKSTDSGTTWKNISRSSAIPGQNWIAPYVNDIDSDPDNRSTVYAGAGYLGGGNVYRSLDGGLNWNSNDTEEWNGVFATDGAVLKVLCDGDDDPGTDYPYVWIGTNGMGVWFAPDGENFQTGGVISDPKPYEENKGDGSLSNVTFDFTSKTETWTVTCYDVWGDDDNDPDTPNIRTSIDWRVEGSESGVQSTRVTRYGQKYVSDNNEVSFVISEGTTSFGTLDSFSFDITVSGLDYGTYVYDIVKVEGTHGESAILYAASGSGLFKSTDGGRTWSARGNFTGDFINVLVLHPSAAGGENDVVYAGTEDAGVWVSIDSGRYWTPYNSGLEKGLNASVPAPDKTNKGVGMMTAVTVLQGCLSEKWMVACKEAVPNGGVFSVTGTVSGPREDYDITTGVYTLPNVLSFTINDGTRSGGTGGFEVGDTFTFTTTQDTGRTIKDLMVDPKNHLLYAVTYFMGPLEPHAVGNVYVRDLRPDGSVVPGDWREANIGLPLYDPPDDTTLFAQHVMAADNPENPRALYIGGEGINFFKATTGLDAGAPVWQESKSGLTNLIMARTTVLFSGKCEKTINVDANGNYTIYVEDKNGNPPIAASKIVIHYDNNTFSEYRYPDVLVHKGTWRDRSDSSTNDPFGFDNLTSINFDIYPAGMSCDIAPGCSWGWF
ncbi:invasin domain 3-containing protein [Desulfobacterales bacterium HSG2]|nr:invasin domain 3-containing protein [Desulfobacterales bacterium HSG2]